MTNPATQSVLFPALLDRPVIVRFEKAATSTDGGAILLSAIDRSIGLTERLATAIRDGRHPGKVVHGLVDLVRQRVFGLACGYADCNDAKRLRDDPRGGAADHGLILPRSRRHIGWLIAREVNMGTVRLVLAGAFALALASPSLRAESSSPADTLALTAGPDDGSLEVRATYWIGTSRPHRLLIAWREGSRTVGRELVWYRIGTRPSAGSWREMREWSRSSRPNRRLLGRNCGHRPQFDGEIAWCVADNDASDARWPAELLALAPLLWEMPGEPYSGCLDGSGLSAQVREGDRLRRVEYPCLGSCNEPPCSDPLRVMNVRRTMHDPPQGWHSSRPRLGR